MRMGLDGVWWGIGRGRGVGNYGVIKGGGGDVMGWRLTWRWKWARGDEDVVEGGGEMRVGVG